MSEWLKETLEHAKNNFESMPAWVQESVRSQQTASSVQKQDSTPTQAKKEKEEQVREG